jgi:hypothetical protein
MTYTNAGGNKMTHKGLPCLNAGIYAYFAAETDISALERDMQKGTTFRMIENEIEATIIEVTDCYDCDINAVLTKLFSQCNLNLMENAVHLYGCKIHIGLWYYSGETGPALIFEGENMSIIHRLNADLSIDAY